MSIGCSDGQLPCGREAETSNSLDNIFMINASCDTEHIMW